MKILVVCQYFSPEQFRINDICFELVKRGNDVTVLTGLPNYPSGVISQEYRKGKRRKEVINGVKVVRVPIVGRGNNLIKLILNYLTYAFNASRAVKRLDKDFDIVYVYQLSPVTMVYPASKYKKLTGAPLLLYCLDLWPESIAAAKFGQKSLLYKILLRMSRKLYNSADKIQVTSSSFRDYFKDVIAIEDLSKVKYLPQYAEELFEKSSGKDAGKNPGTNSPNSPVKNKTTQTINLVFAGNIGEMQSVETILHAAKELEHIENLKWHILGSGSSYEKCLALAQELGLIGNDQNQDNGRVIFHGQKPLNEMPKYYEIAHAMLVTLKSNKFISYTLPGKVQSYMAAGKPIIAAIDGEASVIIKEASCGLTGPAEDYKVLTDNVMDFINSREKWAEYAIKSKEYYDKNFSKRIFFKRLEEDLTELSKNRR